ncbi:hypothetical protein DITRI_Ditri20bG0044100 [Diplodiscus trichospermus]
MAEAIVSTILGQLRVMAIDEATEAWTLVRGVEEEVNQLERNFKALQSELEDAEAKQYQNKRLKHWLDRFKEVSYDMEDVLDDWKTAVEEMQTADHGAESSTSCVPKWMACPLWKVFVSCFSFGSEVVKRHDIATRIKVINKELDQIVKNKNDFNLTKREIIEQPKRQESSAFVDVSKLLGRDEVKEDIIRTLLCGTSEEEGSSIPTISIVGMGGLGKTALAQLIYNDHRINTHFSKRIWVCVSHPFDKFKIARAILENLDPDSTVSLQNTISLQALFSKIRKNIEGKKFFLVMDDVWINHGQDWEELKASFQSCMSGSRILVTTSKESVAEYMKSAVIPLDKLSDDICWRILSQNAFTERSKISCENLEDVGRAIAKKCKGLPLQKFWGVSCNINQEEKSGRMF